MPPEPPCDEVPAIDEEPALDVEPLAPPVPAAVPPLDVLPPWAGAPPTAMMPLPAPLSLLQALARPRNATVASHPWICLISTALVFVEPRFHERSRSAAQAVDLFDQWRLALGHGVELDPLLAGFFQVPVVERVRDLTQRFRGRIGDFLVTLHARP